MLTNLKESLALRLAIIASLTLLLLIPMAFIRGLITERESTHNQAVHEVAGKWGGHQTISGPFLSIPFQKGASGVEYAHFLPEQLRIDGKVEPNLRYRGLYEVLLFQAELRLSGHFDRPDLATLGIDEETVDWQRATIFLGIEDPKGIKEIIKVNWNAQELISESGLVHKQLVDSGVSLNVPIDSSKTRFDFATRLTFNGSEGLSFTPVGRHTQTTLHSSWPNPSFSGFCLPDSRSVTGEGFDAEWKILQANRAYPQQWVGLSFSPKEATFGVDFIFPVDEYQKTMRTAKYALMFIAITFLACFMIELLNERILHPVQYLLTGFALLLFYTLLLSFSEHLSFGYAYWISCLAIVSIVTAYLAPALQGLKPNLFVAGTLVTLYTYFFIILQMEDFALMTGSIGLFLILSTFMWLTRKLDWFSILSSKPDAS